MADTADQLAAHLHAIKQQRRDGILSMSAYYQQLLMLLSEVANLLSEEVQSMSDEEIMLQVPIVLLFLEEQVRRMNGRA